MNEDKLRKWVLVVDSDAVSAKQLEVCQRIRPPLHGVVDCSGGAMNNELCHEAAAFPTFCHAKTKVCVAGLRLSEESFAKLGDLA